MRRIVLVAHNLRSTHNVGSLLRTAEGLGVNKVYLTGYTPYPRTTNDPRLPHLAQKLDKQIAKTALGAEKLLAWQYSQSVVEVLNDLKKRGYVVVALEQTPGSVNLADYNPPDNIVVIVGREVEGLEPEILAVSDLILQIPMFGHKESFNVVQAAAMALFRLRFAE